MIVVTLKICWANLAAVPSRGGTALIVIFSMAIVAGTLTAVFGMAAGFQALFTKAQRADRVLILKSGDLSGTGSSISAAQAQQLTTLSWANNKNGSPMSGRVKFGGGRLDTREGQESVVSIRGVDAGAQDIWPEAKLVRGRWYERGLRELVVGRSLLRRFPTMEIGGQVTIGKMPWTIVGLFESDGSLLETEAWADVDVVMNSYSRTNQYSSFVGVLPSTAALGALKTRLENDPTLGLVVVSEADYYSQQSARATNVMRLIGVVVASIMSLGALLGITNIMYVVVSQRAKELAILRSLGFTAVPIVSSILSEAIVLCTTGALLGAGLSAMLFNGFIASTIGPGLSYVTFAFSASAETGVWIVVLSTIIAAASSCAPACRVMRRDIADALR